MQLFRHGCKKSYLTWKWDITHHIKYKIITKICEIPYRFAIAPVDQMQKLPTPKQNQGALKSSQYYYIDKGWRVCDGSMG